MFDEPVGVTEVEQLSQLALSAMATSSLDAFFNSTELVRDAESGTGFTSIGSALVLEGGASSLQEILLAADKELMNPAA